MSLRDIEQTARRIESPLFQGAREQLYARGGKIEYSPGGGTQYAPNRIPHRAGDILVDPLRVERYTRFFGTTLQVLRTALIHEMGHFMGELQDKATKPKAEAPPTAHVDWCYMIEARATLFAFKVAKELKAKGLPAYVMAPTPTMDVFSALAEAEHTGKNLLMLAKSYYAADTTYTLYCRREIIWTGDPLAAPMQTIRIVRKRPLNSSGRR